MNCKEAIDVMDHALDNTLLPDLRAGFQEHMEDCSPCRTYLEQLRITREALRRLPPEKGGNARRDDLVDEFIKEFERDRE